MNMNTTVGRTVKTLLWVAVSTGTVAVLSYVTTKPELFSPAVVAGANVILVLIKNLFDPRVKNV